jgi:teichuronic acid biosynthesis glycosyltransferase TuaH
VNKVDSTAVSQEPTRLGPIGHPRVLFVMHIDWGFIWQRPHELAKQLAKEYDVRVAFAYGRHRSVMRNNSRTGLVVRPFFQLPFRRRSPLLADINRFLVRIVLGAMVSGDRPDVIWLTHPEQAEYLPSGYHGKIVYDCMDDALAFPQPTVFTERLKRDEAALVARSDLVLTSSASLGETLRTRYGLGLRTRLVRNACAEYPATTASTTARGADGLWHLGYVGMTSTLDFQALRVLVSSCNDLFLDMYGPVDWDVKAEHLSGRICWHGPIAHQDISTRLDSCCCLVAPYRLNDRVLGADSVKLYDYVLIGKPIVARGYPEIGRFSDFVEFYDTPQELVGVISRMCSERFARKYTEDQRTAFLSENTWDVRGQQIRRELQDVLSRGKG